jgi:hypothetical protein
MRPLSNAVLACLASLAGATYADTSPPPNIRVCVQFIELPHPVLTELLAGKDQSGPVLHQQAMELVKSSKAKVLESCVLMTRNNSNAAIESSGEVTYPTVYETTPSADAGGSPRTPGALYFGCGGGSMLPAVPQKPISTTAPVAQGNPASFEIRNPGISIEIEPTVDTDNHIVDLRFESEVVALDHFATMLEQVRPWGGIPFRLPVFKVLRTNTGITLKPGQFELAGLITPKPANPVPPVSRKILLFVRADIIPVGA